MANLAVLGVNTAVGKTQISTQLLRALHENQLRVAPFKPLESGTEEFHGIAQDAFALHAAAQMTLPLETVCPWPLPKPVAPAEELERLGMTLSIQDIQEAAARLQIVSQRPHLLFEGAGGVLSPLSWAFNALDLAHALPAAVLLVAKDELGAQSAVLTAIESVERRNIPLLGVVLNRFENETSVNPGANQRALQKLGVKTVWTATQTTLETALVDRCLQYFLGA